MQTTKVGELNLPVTTVFHQNRFSVEGLQADCIDFVLIAEDNDVVELPKINEDLRNFFLPRKHVAPEPEFEPEVSLIDTHKLFVASTEKGTQCHTGAHKLVVQVRMLKATLSCSHDELGASVSLGNDRCRQRLSWKLQRSTLSTSRPAPLILRQSRSR